MCAITEKKLQLNIVRLCCHNFLSLVEFWLGGPGPPGPPPGYAYGSSTVVLALLNYIILRSYSSTKLPVLQPGG